MKLISFPRIKQRYEYDCGAKCVQGVLSYYGIKVGEDRIIKLAGTKKDAGTSINGSLNALRRYGLKCIHGKFTAEKLKGFVDRKIPVMILIQDRKPRGVKWKDAWSEGHYVVVVGYDCSKIYFQDPYLGMRKGLSFRELVERWHDKDEYFGKCFNYGIAVKK